MTEHIIEDGELGKLFVRVNARARRLTFRTKDDGIHVTVPPGTAWKELHRAIEQLRPRLREARAQMVCPLLGWDYRIDAECFKLRLVSGGKGCFQMRMKPDGVEILCPPATDFADTALQTALRKWTAEGMRRHASVVLPARLSALSQAHRLPYNGVSINSSKGRWGSCSARGHINLSFRLLLLPAHLIDYVLLHELAHTREMNHGERFWALLNVLTDGKAKALRQELKEYRSEF